MSSSSQLALLGGAKRYAAPLHVGRPNVGDRARFLARVEEILDSRWFTNDGRTVKEFERRIAELVGVKHCLAICNATVALEIAYRALGFTGEVVVPSYTFIATAHSLQWQGVTPLFADMDPRTHNLDVASAERLITPRTTGIVGVHVWGRPCDTEAIEDLARRRGLKVMFDAAHALACSHRGRMIGSFGACEVFSLHSTKFAHSFEGGAIVTNDDALAERIRLMRNFGFAGYDRVIHPGVNGKMTEVCAAMGLTNLEAVDGIIAANYRNYLAYTEGLRGLPGIDFIRHDTGERRNYQYCVMEVDPEVCPLNRDELVEVLHAENILARKYFWPGCHRMEPYRSYYPLAGLALPHTERIAARVVVLPTGTAIQTEDVGAVVDVIRTALQESGKVRQTLARRAG